MKVKDQAAWDQTVLLNDPIPYGKQCVDFALRLADGIEFVMDTDGPLPSTIEQVLTEAGREHIKIADTEGITPFQMGAAVQILSYAWEYGHQLMTWWIEADPTEEMLVGFGMGTTCGPNGG